MTVDDTLVDTIAAVLADFEFNGVHVHSEAPWRDAAEAVAALFEPVHLYGLRAETGYRLRGGGDGDR